MQDSCRMDTLRLKDTIPPPNKEVRQGSVSCIPANYLVVACRELFPILNSNKIVSTDLDIKQDKKKAPSRINGAVK